MYKYFITGLLAATILSPVAASAAPNGRDEVRGGARAEGNYRGQANLDRGARNPAQRVERRDMAPAPRGESRNNAAASRQTAPIPRAYQSAPVYSPPPASAAAREYRGGRNPEQRAERRNNPPVQPPVGGEPREYRGDRARPIPTAEQQNRWRNRDRNPAVTQPSQSVTRETDNRYDRNNNGRLDRTWDRNRDGEIDRRFDRNGNKIVDRTYDRNRDGDLDRRYDRDNNGRLDRRHGYNNGHHGNGYNRGNDRYRDNRYDRDNRHRWNREWRSSRHYDWHSYRNKYRNHYRLGRYYAPYRDYRYRRFDIGFYLGSSFLGSNYWINDPYRYRLPAAYAGTRWIRYYNDVLLVDTYTGEVLDVIHNFFW